MFRCSADISSAKSERRNFVYCAAKFNEYYGDSANNSAEHRRTCCQNRCQFEEIRGDLPDRKSTRLNSSHVSISYAVFCLKKKKKRQNQRTSQAHAQALFIRSRKRC